jgi:hypothetical protein
MRDTRKTMKLYALAVAVAAALTTTACEPSEGDRKSGGKTSPSASAPSKPDAGSSGANTGGSGGEDGTYEYADRQTPPQGSVCDNGGQGPYGVIESVNFGGEAPNTTIGLALGQYECGWDLMAGDP